MKEFFDSLTRAEIEIIASGNISEELKAQLRQEGFSQKNAIAYAKEALKYIPEEEATIEEEIDPDKYWTEEQTQEPTQAQEEEEETDEQKLYTEIEAVAPQQAGKKSKTAVERLSLLKKLSELEKKYLQTETILNKVIGLEEEHKENESVTLQIMYEGRHAITISKNFAVAKCLSFAKEETQKQLKQIESDIEALEF